MSAESVVRTYSFLAGVLKNQQRDPWCGSCKAYVNSVAAVRRSLDEFKTLHGTATQSLSPVFSRIFQEAERVLAEIELPDNTPGQKTAGNCKLPQGICFAKSSKAMLQHV